jgi:hypothetical protein
MAFRSIGYYKNVVRQAWNNLAALRHALNNNKQIFISPSYDEGAHQL